jgi:hypothetical protein
MDILQAGIPMQTDEPELNRGVATMATTNEQPKESRPRGRVIPLPGLPALPHLPALPGIRQLSWLRPQVKLPSRDKMLLYAGLGAMAAIDLIDWPVAAAIAMAQVLTSSGSRSQSLPEVSVHRGEAPAGDKAPAAAAPSPARKAPARRPRAQQT